MSDALFLAVDVLSFVIFLPLFFTLLFSKAKRIYFSSIVTCMINMVQFPCLVTSITTLVASFGSGFSTGSTACIVLCLVAVVLGFVLQRAVIRHRSRGVSRHEVCAFDGNADLCDVSSTQEQIAEEVGVQPVGFLLVMGKGVRRCEQVRYGSYETAVPVLDIPNGALVHVYVTETVDIDDSVIGGQGEQLRMLVDGVGQQAQELKAAAVWPRRSRFLKFTVKQGWVCAVTRVMGWCYHGLALAGLNAYVDFVWRLCGTTVRVSVRTLVTLGDSLERKTSYASLNDGPSLLEWVRVALRRDRKVDPLE